VTADIALWPIRFTSTDDVLARAQQKFDESRQAIVAFLARNGIEAQRVELQSFEVADAMADRYRAEAASSRYIISGTLMVRVEDPALVQKASQNVGELAQTGWWEVLAHLWLNAARVEGAA
jgi:hypothetical protein